MFATRRFFRGSFFDFQAGSFWDSSGSLLKTGKLQVVYLCLSRVGHWTFFFIFVLRHLPCVPLLGLSHSPWLVQIQMDCPISTGATSTDEGLVFFSKLQWRMFSEPWKVLEFVFLVFLFWIHTLLHLQWANVDHAWLCPSGMFCWYRCNEFWFATRRSAAATAVFSNLAGGKRLFAPCYCTDSTDAVQSFRGHLSCLELNTNQQCLLNGGQLLKSFCLGKSRIAWEHSSFKRFGMQCPTLFSSETWWWKCKCSACSCECLPSPGQVEAQSPDFQELKTSASPKSYVKNI